MESLLLEAGDYTPKINFDIQSNTFELSGSSLPEDATSFYNPIISWMEKYGETAKKPILVVFNLDYINSSSSKKIVDIFFTLEKLKNQGVEVEIEWRYPEDDDIMESIGDSFKDITKVPFRMKPYGY